MKKNLKIKALLMALAFVGLSGFGANSTLSMSVKNFHKNTVRRSAFRPIHLAANYGRLPLAFETNQGQTDPQAQYMAHGRGYSLFITGQEAVLVLKKPA